jgi:beta-xylosidase
VPRLSSIHLRDPFLLPVPDEGVTYLFGSTDPDPWNPPGLGFDCWRSADLVEWEGPIAAFRPPPDFWADRKFWAPEVHFYQGRYFMFASFKATDAARGTAVLAADSPAGPYVPWSDGPVTPRDWECLDGTLYVDPDGEPWIVYCHEWLQVVDGRMIAQRLTPDLLETTGEPVELFRASSAPWVGAGDPAGLYDEPAYVTDGPWLHRLASGTLIMLWSSGNTSGSYAMGIARSLTGDVLGPWEHQAEPLWADDGGHGMIVRALDGRLLVTLHQPNQTPLERPVFAEIEETEHSIVLAD